MFFGARKYIWQTILPISREFRRVYKSVLTLLASNRNWAALCWPGESRGGGERERGGCEARARALAGSVGLITQDPATGLASALEAAPCLLSSARVRWETRDWDKRGGGLSPLVWAPEGATVRASTQDILTTCSGAGKWGEKLDRHC